MGNIPNSSQNLLTDDEKLVYEWQMWTPGFGEEGQQKLKQSTVLVSRCGGLGGVVAYQLAAAGIGRLVIAHAGNVRHSDLNRQLLMTHDWIGKPRIESIRRRLQELNPRLEVVGLDQNMDEALAERWVREVDVCVGAAPMFQERLALSDACVRFNKPLVNCAMYDTSATIATFPPGGKPCLRCMTPSVPPYWKRQFPVFGATSGTVGCMGAMEVIKLLAGFGQPLLARCLTFDLRTMLFSHSRLDKLPPCPLCR